MRQPFGMTILEYANKNIGFQWESEVYGAGTNVEFGIYWSYNHWGVIYEGNEAGAVIEQLNSRQYQIGYEAAGDDWDYNELVILVTIEDYELLVEIEPAVISAGEEAIITVKKQYMDGRVEEFPAGQMFEAGMMEGCAAGGMINGTDTVAYINGITQPIKFVAADSLENEEETVRIGVGLLGTGERVIKMKQKSENKNREKIEKQEETNTELIIGEYCFPGNFISNRVGEVSIVIQKSVCDEWACQSGFNNYTGKIEIQEVRENYNNINYCSFSLAHVYPPAAGIFMPLFDEKYPVSLSEKIKGQLIANYDLDVCFDKNNRYWKYQISENAIFLRAILDVCEDNILSGTSQYIIHNLNELSIIPNEEVCLALENFENQRLYGGGGKYYLIAPVWAHEKVHKANFEKLIKKVLNMKKEYFGNEYTYKKLLSDLFRPECNETTNNENNAQFQIKKYLNTILKSFVVDLYKTYNIAKGKENNETNTQNHPDVQWKISEYKKELQKNRSKEFWESCPYKEKDI
ncbi:MAG: hypothetical protein ACK4R9_10100 [Ignavibacterium sp.]